MVMGLTFTSGRKIPKAIKRLNKALGLPTKSEALWNIIDIPDIQLKLDQNINDVHENITDLDIRVDRLENIILKQGMNEMP